METEYADGLVIRVLEVKNGFIIEKHSWVKETCATLKEYWVANEGGEAAEIVRKIIPKG